MAGTPVRGTPARGGQVRTSLAQFTERERGRGAVMPGTFRAAVTAEMGQAFSPPYQVPIVVAVNGLLIAGAWFLLPRGWLFTLQSALAFPVVLSSWMYADVPATNVLAPGGFQPVESRHADVHEDHVGPELSGQVHGVGPVGRRTDDLDVVAGVEQRLETGADQALVIGEQDPDHRAGPAGRRALTRNPPPGRNPADR